MPAHASTSVGGLTLDQARHTILSETNAARSAAGLPPVRMTIRLNEVAQNWSKTMASEQKMYHNPNYSKQYPSGWSRAAENVAHGYRVSAVTSAWLNSPGHRANILEKSTNYIGIGIATASNGQLYYTQNFATYSSTPTDVISSASGSPTPGYDVKRLSGSDRYATSISISSRFAPGVPVVYVASGANFPDALAAAPAAAAQGGPLLLTPAGSLPSTVLAELKRLKPHKIVVVGGKSVVSDKVVQQLKTVQSNVRRDAGSDRYSTAAKIVEQAFPSAKQAYIATGANFPDALSGSAAAASKGMPVILVPSSGSSSRLPSETKALLQRLGVTKVTILGGTGVVSSRIQSDLGSFLGSSNVSRIGGADRFSTSTAINKAAFGSSTPAEVFFATGSGFADALSGGALAGKSGSPLYLVSPHCVPAQALKDMKAMGVKKVTLLGGTGVLSSGLSRLPSC